MTTHSQYAEDLALFALGALEGEAREKLAAHLETCGECQRELQELRGCAGILALSSPLVQPHARSRSRLLAAIHKEPRHAKESRRVGWWGWAGAVTSAVFAVWSAVLWNENSHLERSLRAMTDELRTTENQFREKQELVSLLTAPDSVQMLLTASPTPKLPQARLVYQKNSGKLLLLASNLAPLPSDKTYELWLLPADGRAPVPAGLFKPNEGGYSSLIYQGLTPGAAPKAFAVTIEKAAGSNTPTMPIIMVTQASS